MRTSSNETANAGRCRVHQAEHRSPDGVSAGAPGAHAPRHRQTSARGKPHGMAAACAAVLSRSRAFSRDRPASVARSSARPAAPAGSSPLASTRSADAAWTASRSGASRSSECRTSSASSAAQQHNTTCNT
eukprot:4218420-Prymnesium_polylepis.1